MLMNNGQNTRSYSPVPSQSKTESASDLLKKHIKKQISHEVMIMLTLNDLAESYWKMGLCGHMYKTQCKANMMNEMVHKWKCYYREIFDECAPIEVSYTSVEPLKTIDAIHNRMYELFTQSKQNMEKILEYSTENHSYSNMKMLLKIYNKCEKAIEKLEAKMRSAQTFGYDVAQILSVDREYVHKYKKHKKYEEKHKEEK